MAPPAAMALTRPLSDNSASHRETEPFDRDTAVSRHADLTKRELDDSEQPETVSEKKLPFPTVQQSPDGVA